MPQGPNHYANGVPSRKRMRCDSALAAQAFPEKPSNPSCRGLEIPDALLDDMVSSLEQTFGSDAIEEFMSGGDLFANIGFAKLMGESEGMDAKRVAFHGDGTGKDEMETSLLISALEFQGEDQIGIVDGPYWGQL